MGSYNPHQKILLILQTTKDLILESGINVLNIREIAKRANLSIGSIYRYFPEGIPSIIKQMANETKKDTTLFIENFSSIKSPNVLIHALIDRLLFYHRDNIALLRAFETTLLADPENYGDFWDFINFDEESITQISILFSKFSKINKELLKVKLNQITSIIDAAIHRHILNKPIASTDGELVKILTEMALMMLQN